MRHLNRTLAILGASGVTVDRLVDRTESESVYRRAIAQWSCLGTMAREGARCNAMEIRK